jgi:hypothetical protein
MAEEVTSQSYLFQDIERVAEKSIDFDELLAMIAGKSTRHAKRVRRERLKVPKWHFFHNPLHDVESVWWGCVELLFKRRIECSTIPQLKEQYRVKYFSLRYGASRIFPDPFSNPSHRIKDRGLFLEGSITFTDKLQSALPPALDNISEYLRVYRVNLVSRYRQAEYISKPDGTILEEVFKSGDILVFAGLLRELRWSACGMKMGSFPREWDDESRCGYAWDAELLCHTWQPRRKEDADQQAGSKCEATEPPDNAGNAEGSNSGAPVSEV